MSQRRANGPVVAGTVQAPEKALHDAQTKQLELGAVTVILHAYPDKLATPELGEELIRRQIAALREFADTFEASLCVQLGTPVCNGGDS